CLILDNHPIFGGEGKQNEFLVNGQRLIAPQGANTFRIPTPKEPAYEVHQELGVPLDFEHRKWEPALRPMEVARDNFALMLWADHSPSLGWFYDQSSYGSTPQWIRDVWTKNLEGTPYPPALKKEFLRWRATQERPYKGKDFERWLDGMTYEAYLT